MGEEEKRIKAMVAEANRLSKTGRNTGALTILEKAAHKATYMFPIGAIDRSKGLIYHYKDRIYQAMGECQKAMTSLEYAIGFRSKSDDPVAKAYSVFQQFICKIYCKLPISEEEVEETKMALTAAMAKKTAAISDIGNMMQNLAYVEQIRGDIEKAILFYEMTLKARETAGDGRGYALTQARLAEIYWNDMEGMGSLATEHGMSALEYFEKINDVERIKQVKDIFGWEWTR